MYAKQSSAVVNSPRERSIGGMRKGREMLSPIAQHPVYTAHLLCDYVKHQRQKDAGDMVPIIFKSLITQ